MCIDVERFIRDQKQRSMDELSAGAKQPFPHFIFVIPGSMLRIAPE
jgi:hypothetical protein